MIFSTPSQIHCRFPEARGEGETAGRVGVPVPIVAGGGWEAGRSGADAAFTVQTASENELRISRQRRSTK
jgi:hypothetical protein